MLTCSKCGKQYEYKHHNKNTKSVCGPCVVTRKRALRKDQCISYKGGRCSICGYSKCSRALQFHHLNGTDKSFNISGEGRASRSWELVKAELDKTILVCANCHAEIESGLLSL